ncbi:MAG: Maf family protein [Oscillospiraceae bacterium]
MALVLASASPRRRALLRLITPAFEVAISHTDETLPARISPSDAVALLALRKARAVWEQRPNDIVIGADTIVALGRDILGKPQDATEAAAMLRRLSGKTHRVYTGVSILDSRAEHSFVSWAEVQFSRMTEEEILDYARTGEGHDKAGSYAIQGQAARFIKGIKGDYYTVMGLPVCRLYHLLHKLSLL